MDTSAYEAYEKQEGDFVEGAEVTTPVDAALEAAAGAEATDAAGRRGTASAESEL